MAVMSILRAHFVHKFYSVKEGIFFSLSCISLYSCELYGWRLPVSLVPQFVGLSSALESTCAGFCISTRSSFVSYQETRSMLIFKELNFFEYCLLVRISLGMRSLLVFLRLTSTFWLLMSCLRSVILRLLGLKWPFVRFLRPL